MRGADQENLLQWLVEANRRCRMKHDMACSNECRLICFAQAEIRQRDIAFHCIEFRCEVRIDDTHRIEELQRRSTLRCSS